MIGKLMFGAVAILVTALLAYLGHLLITAYGTSRYDAGLAAGRVAAMAQIIAAQETATKAVMAAQERTTIAEQRHGDEVARIAAIDQRSLDEVQAYETSEAGHAGCLDAERVHGIEAARAALFSAAAPADGDLAGPMPADAAQDGG